LLRVAVYVDAARRQRKLLAACGTGDAVPKAPTWVVGHGRESQEARRSELRDRPQTSTRARTTAMAPAW